MQKRSIASAGESIGDWFAGASVNILASFLRGFLAIAIVLVTGCNNSSFEDCTIACTDGNCPDGFSCGAEGLCRLDGAAGLCSDDPGPDPNAICTPATTAACYTGEAGTKGVGACRGGTRTCDATGHWGDCAGEVVPTAEACGDAVDNDCNGSTDENGDLDGDGFSTCTVGGGAADCCDTVADCDDPASVNPGSFDIPDNDVDDDCNLVTDDQILCDATLSSGSTSAYDFAKAIELCDRATASDKKWGVLTAKLSLASGTGTPDPQGHAIRPEFGPGGAAQLGDSVAIISSGGAAAKFDTNPGFHAFSGYAHVQGATSTMPSDWLTANNNVLPKAPGCPQPTAVTANDPVMLTFQIRVPLNAKSFELRSSFYSADYPEYLCSTLNDYFLVLLDSQFSGAPANPTDKNLAFYKPTGTTSKVPIGVNLARSTGGMFTECLNGATGCQSGGTPGTMLACTGTDMLEDTGFDDLSANNCETTSIVGGGTGWLVTRGNVVPGETITLRIVIWDQGDSILDSLAVLDGFRWSTALATPGTTKL